MTTTDVAPQHDPPALDRERRVARQCPGCPVMREVHPCYPGCGA